MNARRVHATVLAIALAATGWVATAHAAPVYREGELLLRFAVGTTADEAESILEDHGLEIAGNPDPSGWMLVSGPESTAALLASLEEVAAVSAEPNYVATAAATIDPAARTWTPDDTYFAQQWSLAGMPAAWFHSRGAGVVVAVLDTGLRMGLGESPHSLLTGIDVVNGDLDPDDDNGHGTYITSIIAQATDNATGRAGVAPDASIIPIKVLDQNGHGSARTVAEGIYYATDGDAKVINLSLALSPTVAWSEALHDAVAYAAAHDVVVVAAAGNDAAGEVALPAAFNEVIAVGALTAPAGGVPGVTLGGSSGTGAPAAYSNRGAALDLVAPGGDEARGVEAASFDPATGVERVTSGWGTSVAAAHVAGTAANLVGSGESRDRIRSSLELSATNVVVGGESTSGWDDRTGYGKLDPGASLSGSVEVLSESSLQGFVPSQP